MVIVMIIENAFSPDQRVLKESEALKKLGHEVSVLAWDRLVEHPQDEIVSGIRVHRIRIRSGYAIGWMQVFYIWRFWISAFSKALTFRPDVVICHDLHTLGAGFLLKLARGNALRVIYDIHDMYAAREAAGDFGRGVVCLRLLEKLFTTRFDAFVTVGEEMKKYFSKLAGGRPFIVCGNWYDAYELPFFEREAMMRKLGLSWERPRVGYVGSILSGRGIELLAEVARLKPEWDIVVAGGREGAEGDATINGILRIAEKRHQNLFLLGWVSDPLKYFSLLDVSVYALDPSCAYHTKYAAPNNVFSCIATATPMVTTRCGELNEIGMRYRFIEFIEEIKPDRIIVATEMILSGNISAYRREAKRAQGEFNASRATSVLCELVASLDGKD